MNSERRTGGDVVAESLASLGAVTVFGEPGQHALGIFSALGNSTLGYIGARTETCAVFAADGYSRVTDLPGVVVISTGPGALLALSGLQEALAASIPVVVVASQVPRDGLGGARRGYLHELDAQAAAAAQVTKRAVTAAHVSQIEPALRVAWETAVSVPSGPVWVEIPADTLLTCTSEPAPTSLTIEPRLLAPQPGTTREVVRLLNDARSPAILAGGGVSRAHGEEALLALAERLRAPVATTFGGKGVFPWRHPLSLQSWLEDAYLTTFLADADVLLVVGSGLGELSSNYRSFEPHGQIIQVDADLRVIGANYPVLGVHADARLAVEALAAGVVPRPHDGLAERRVADVLGSIRARLDAQDLGLERGLLAAIRSALPFGCANFWDMTILGYWAWSAWEESAPRRMHSAQGAGGLGYALPAAIGAAVGSGQRTLAVSGDGGAMYGLSELGTMRAHDLPVTWLVVDDGGYGILREYMDASFGSEFGVRLPSPDFVQIARAFGVPASTATAATLEERLVEALQQPGPNVVVLSAAPRMFAPTHVLPGGGVH